jgi:hypothetical protein
MVVGLMGAIAVTATLSASATAWAQAPAGPGGALPLPLMVSLKKIPIGSWSEYQLDDGHQKFTTRVALVARSGTAAQMETQINGGPFRGVDKVVVRVTLPLEDAAEIRPIEQVLQLGAGEPMLLPAGGYAQAFRKVDPAKRLGVEEVQVAAGKFSRADHHREKGAVGETIDFWLSKDVLPFGLIKTISTPSAGGTPVSMELVAKGGGAKAQITKKPGPFNPGALAAAAGAARGGGATGAAEPAGAPPPGVPARPIPSPHPGMPPTPPASTRPPASGK